jgi:hypothetical protein
MFYWIEHPTLREIFISLKSTSDLKVGIMNKIKLIAALSGIVLVLAAMIPIYAALETNIQTVADRTLTTNLGPDFSVSQSSTASNTKGYIQQNVTIVNNKYPQLQAYLLVFSYYGDYISVIDPSALSTLMEKQIINSFTSTGNSEIGSWTATSKIGQNVTVHTLSASYPSINSGSTKMDVAFWHLDKGTYIGLISNFDRNTTQQIIATTAIK